MAKGARWSRRQCLDQLSTTKSQQPRNTSLDLTESAEYGCIERLVDLSVEQTAGFEDCRRSDPADEHAEHLFSSDASCSGHSEIRRIWRRRVCSNEKKQPASNACSATAMCKEAGCYVKLQPDVWMPTLGLGTGSEPLEVGACRKAIVTALQCGYRMLDLNVKREKEAAQAMAQCHVQREDIFLLTKLTPQDHGSISTVTSACRASLRRLAVDFFDLYLVTSPRGGHLIDTWKAMLHIRQMGLSRAVGVSNFGVQHLRALQHEGLELPSVNQVELHVWRQQSELARFCKVHGVVLMAYSSLGRGRFFGHTQLSALAGRLNRSEADLCLRWCMQIGHAAIPKSFDAKHISENFDSWIENSSALSPEVMYKLECIDCDLHACAAASRAQALPWEEVAHCTPDWQALEKKTISNKGQS